MDSPVTIDIRADNDVTSLVLAALGQSTITGLSEVLKSLALSMNAYGCILWQIAPISRLDQDPPEGRLFIQADWFRDASAHPVHELPLESLTGKVILNHSFKNVPDVHNDPDIYAGSIFLQEANIKSLCTMSIGYRGQQWGALNIYRKDSLPFTEVEVAKARHLASLIPSLYQTIRDEVSYKLILKVNEVVHKAESAQHQPIPKSDFIKRLQRMCTLVADTFQCLETSIFLEDPLEKPKIYELMATTWPWPDFPQRIYKKKDRRSLTGWVLSHPKSPVRIFDLAKFDRDIEAIHRDYPGLQWNDSLKIRSAALEYFNISDPQKLQALSLMAAPIAVGGHILGVIRCCTAKRGPYYFGDHELGLLNLVAAQIGRFWNNWLRQREIQEENSSWKALVSSVGQLNNFVQSELKKVIVDEGNIYGEALRITSDVIKGADILDVRLRATDDSNQLFFAKTFGKAWYQGKEHDIKARLSRRFPIDGKSAGAYVFRTRTVYESGDVRTAEHYDATFQGLTKRLIVAPIQIESDNVNEPYGVLDVRGTGSRPFPKHAKAIAELIGQQLALYHFLANNISKLHKAEADLLNSVKIQTQTFEDLEHQLRSPINQAYARIQSVLRGELNDEKLELDLLTIRGLCGKARQVTRSIGLFSDLASERPIKARISRINQVDLYKMLYEAAVDNRLMVDPKRSINFHINKESLDVLSSHDVSADHDLLEQAINNILDNAYKYSYNKTHVRIYGGLTASERFHISVANKGIPIRREDIRHIANRGWRSNQARWTTGEGSGIGLWIVENIMKAQGGELIILPTNPEGMTEIKMVFPTTRRK